MRPYRVTVVMDGKRHAYDAVGPSWYEVWLSAVVEFGIAACVIVKPV